MHGRQQDFFQEWAMRGSEGRKSPIGVQGQSPGGGYFLKIMHKYFVYRDFRQHHGSTNTLRISGEGREGWSKCLPCPCLPGADA